MRCYNHSEGGSLCAVSQLLISINVTYLKSILPTFWLPWGSLRRQAPGPCRVSKLRAAMTPKSCTDYRKNKERLMGGRLRYEPSASLRWLQVNSVPVVTALTRRGLSSTPLTVPHSTC